MIPPTFAPMLARTGLPARDLEAGVVEPKLDGWRIQVAVSGDLMCGYRATTRTGRDVTSSVPEVAALTTVGVDLVLDGEVVAAAGRANDFYKLGGAMARSSRPLGSLTVVVFDLLWLDGHDLTGVPWTQRRRLLDQVPMGAHVLRSTVFEVSDAAALLKACEHEGVEGLMWKRKLAPYEAGKRSSSWRKVKCESWTVAHAPRRRRRG